MLDPRPPQRNQRPFLSLLHWSVSILILLVLAVPSYAAEVDKAKQSQVGWISVVAAIVLVIVVGIGCFMNPKRTHQD